jgi:hypothetical protein
MEVHAITPALGRLRQEDYEFQVSLGYTGRPCLKKKKKNQKKRKHQKKINYLCLAHFSKESS